MRAQAFTKSITPAMKSSQNKQNYEASLLKAYDAQQAALAKRVEANRVHQEKVTKEIIKQIKGEIAEEEKKAGNTEALYAPAEPKYIVAILVRSQCGIAPKPKKTLQLLRLTKSNKCVILKNNECIRNMLQLSKDYIAYGYVSYELLRELVYTRGEGRIGRTHVKLTNENIEDAFSGKFKCIEELLSVIYHGGEETKAVLNFLAPMTLNSPRGGFCPGRKIQTFIQGGVTNNHQELLGELLSRMI